MPSSGSRRSIGGPPHLHPRRFLLISHCLSLLIASHIEYHGEEDKVVPPVHPPFSPNHELATFTAVLLVVPCHAARTTPIVVVVLPQESFVSPLQRWKGHHERIDTCCCCYCCYCDSSSFEDFCSRSSQHSPAAPGRRVASTGTAHDPQTGGGGLESSRVCGGQPTTTTTTTTTTATTATTATTTTRIGISSSRFSTGCHCPRHYYYYYQQCDQSRTSTNYRHLPRSVGWA
jgi:hypothetical protein